MTYTLLLKYFGICSTVGALSGSTVYSLSSKHYSQRSWKKASTNAFEDDVDNLYQIGDTKEKATRLMEEYLKTISGSENLLKSYSASLIKHFFEKDYSQESTSLGSILKNYNKSIKESIKQKFEKMTDEEQKEELFLYHGDKDKYIEHKAAETYKQEFKSFFKQRRKIFIDNNLVSSYSQSDYDANKSNFEFSDSGSATNSKKSISFFGNTQTDTVLKNIGKFWNFVFETWIKKHNPLLVNKKSWDYAKSFSTPNYQLSESAKQLINLPSSPNYYFPDFDSSTNESFKTHINNIFSNAKNDSKIEIISILDIHKKSKTSQSALADLFLYFQPKKELKVDAFNFLSGISSLITGNFEADLSNLDSISSVNEHDLNKKILKFLHIDKNKKISSATKTLDFWTFKTHGKKFLVYKDKNGIHVINVYWKNSLDEKIQKTEFLKLGIEKNFGLKTDANFDLLSVLDEFLDKNFDQIIIDWFVNKKSPSTVDNSETQLIKSLLEMIDAKKYSNLIFDTRIKVMRDYFAFDFSEHIKKDLEKTNKLKAFKLAKGFAGKFPYRITTIKNKTSDTTTTEKYKKVIPFVEDLVFEHLKRVLSISEDIDSSYLKKKFKVYSEKVSQWQLLSKSRFKRHTNKSGIYFSFKYSDNTSSLNFDPKYFLEEVYINGIKNRDIEKLLIQKEITSVVTNYSLKQFDWNQSNRDEKVIENVKNQDLNDNFLFVENADSFKENIFVNEDWNRTNKDRKKIVRFLKSLFWKNRYFNTMDGFDILSNKNIDFFKHWYAIYWLLDNNYNEYRRYLKEVLIKNPIAAYSFTKKYERDLCSKNFQNSKYSASSINDSDLKPTDFLEETAKIFNNETLEENACSNMKDEIQIFSTRQATSNNSSDDFSGYKGLVHSENHEKIDNLPKNFYKQMQKTLSKTKAQKDKLNIIQINNTKTFEEFNSLIKELENTYENQEFYKLLLKEIDLNVSLEKRKSAAINSIKTGCKIGRTIKNFCRTDKSQLNDNFNRFVGYMYSNEGRNKKFVLQDGDEDYISYLVQITKDDVMQQDSFNNFKKIISTDMILYDLIRLAKEPTIQNNAIKTFLSRDKWWTKKGLRKFAVNDYRLMQNINYSWLMQ